MLFDVKEPDASLPVLSPLPIGTPLEYSNYETYSSYWEYHQPNGILDKHKGYLWELGIDLDSVVDTWSDSKPRLIRFLLRRFGSKKLILKVCLTVPSANTHSFVVLVDTCLRY